MPATTATNPLRPLAMKIAATRSRRGFTLIEMLTVVAIIIILAGLVFGGMGFIKRKQKSDLAKIQVKLLANACEEFRTANGTYPGREDDTKGNGQNMSKELYSDLYWDTDRDGSGINSDSDQPVFLSELNPDNNKQKWTLGTGQNVRIVDPWNSEYRYRKGQPAGGKNMFEIWSAGPDGKTDPDNPNSKDNLDDIKE